MRTVMRKSKQFPVTIAIVLTAAIAACSRPASAQNDAQTGKKKQVNSAFAKVDDDPALPRVLLIGDSISIGYTVPTRKLLEGKANLHRIPTNGGPTTRGLENIEDWLGEGRWDVIHFNWGLHDLKYMEGKKQVPLDEYEQNLRKLVERLKRTKAALVWCSTTPVPQGVNPPRKNEEVLQYNAVAARIMKEHAIATDDLYSYANKQLDKIQRPQNVHFTPEGSQILAKQVANSILAARKQKQEKP